MNIANILKSRCLMLIETINVGRNYGEQYARSCYGIYWVFDISIDEEIKYRISSQKYDVRCFTPVK